MTTAVGRDRERKRVSASFAFPLLAALGALVPGRAAALDAAVSAPTGQDGSIGRIDVETVPVDPSWEVTSATYTPGGKVLVTYRGMGSADRAMVKLATMDDDGRNARTFFARDVPRVPKDNGLRFMVMPDDRRIFLGDYVVECTAPLASCTDAALLPVEYPPEVAGGDHVSHRWSEPIVAPDDHHVAWTTLLANYSAVVSVGELRRTPTGYRIVDARLVSTLDPFAKDPKHADGVLPVPVLGGEVKQFVHGGIAISMVGAVRRDLPGSVVQDLATGRKQAVTDVPGYTETTIFSPDERLGLTMTTRFSARTDPAVLGLVPRPYPDSLNMGLSMFAYTYAVTGVRGQRVGNVGPALIDVAKSETQPGYLGIDLSSSDDWVFRSPMSWRPDGVRGMWIEGRRGSQEVRIRTVKLLDRKPSRPVAARATPSAIAFSTPDMSKVLSYARTSQDIDVKVYGRRSGSLRYRRTPAGLIDKTYDGFSDDGETVYSGDERMQAGPDRASTYSARLTVTGPHPGRMDLQVTFGPLGGPLPARIVFDKGPDGQPLSRGYAEFDGKRLDVADLRP